MDKDRLISETQKTKELLTMARTRPFEDWFAEEYNVLIRDMSETNRPRFWKKLSNVGALGIRRRQIFIKDLDKTRGKKLHRTLFHEWEHLKTQRRIGWTIYAIRYGLSRRFRTTEEIRAYTRSMEALFYFNNVTDYPSDYARFLRDNYCVGNRQFRRADKALRKNWEAIKAGEITNVRDMWALYLASRK